MNSENLVEFLQGDIFEAMADADACVVDQDIGRSMRLLRGSDKRCDRRRVGYIALQRKWRGPCSLRPIDCTAHLRLIVHVTEGDYGTFACKPFHDRCPNTTASARDDRAAARQALRPALNTFIHANNSS